MKCIVIDDDLYINEILRIIASNAGFVVESSASAEAFLKRNDFGYACFLVDWFLPGLNGIDLVPMIRKMNPLSTIFMISAANGHPEIKRGLEAGADDYITKPWNTEHLIAKLSNARRKYEHITAVNIDEGVKFIDEAQVLSVGGKKVYLTDAEYKIAAKLYSRKGSSVTRYDLSRILDQQDVGRLVDVHMHSIRRKTQNLNLKIKSQRGIGYIWT